MKIVLSNSPGNRCKWFLSRLAISFNLHFSRLSFTTSLLFSLLSLSPTCSEYWTVHVLYSTAQYKHILNSFHIFIIFLQRSYVYSLFEALHHFFVWSINMNMNTILISFSFELEVCSLSLFASVRVLVVRYVYLHLTPENGHIIANVRCDAMLHYFYF